MVLAWISVHDHVVGGKLRELAKDIGCSQKEALGILVSLWLWGLNNADQTGKLRSCDKSDVAEAVFSNGLSEGLDKMEIVESLISQRWIDENEEGDLYLHDWDTWQEQWYKFLKNKEYDAERKRAERARKKAEIMKKEQIEESSESNPKDNPILNGETNAVYEKLIELCVDICRRNGKTTLLWFADKNKSLNYEPKANEMVLTVHRWFANKSCPGDWLYSRLGDVASRVTSQLGGSSGGGSNSGSSGSYKTGLYKVNVGDLNIRKGPGTNYGINGVITNKGTYTIVEIKNGSWGRLKSGAGWINISSAYCSYVGATSGGGSSNNGSGSAGSNSKTGTYKVDIPDLYIRKGPGTGYAKNGFCPKGVYTIVETKSANGYTWGRLKSGAGWIALDYAKKV